jgi:DNA-binding beta-propeller fold protein YncE
VYASDEPTGRVHKLSARGHGLARWGGNGSESGQFRHPQGLALDMQGNILVADTYNSRIQVLSPAGYSLRTWGESQGNGPGQFDHPADVAVDHQGTIFVADTRNARIQRLSPLGQLLGIWQRGASGQELECPVGVALDEEGNLYVADSAAVPRVVKLSPWGAWIAAWPLPKEEAGGYVQGVAVSSAMEVYATAYSPRNVPAVVKLSPRGEVMAIWK